MGSIRRQRGQALVIIFVGAWLLGGTMAGSGHHLFGGRSAHELRKQLESAVPDEARRKTLEARVRDIESAEKKFVAARHAIEKDALAALERHDATRMEILAIVDRADRTSAESRKEFLDLRFRMRENMSDAEWRAMFSTPPK